MQENPVISFKYWWVHPCNLIPLWGKTWREHSLSGRRIRKTGGGWDKNGELGREKEGGEDDTFMTSAAAFPTSPHRACRSPRASVDLT